VGDRTLVDECPVRRLQVLYTQQAAVKRDAAMPARDGRIVELQIALRGAAGDQHLPRRERHNAIGIAHHEIDTIRHAGTHYRINDPRGFAPRAPPHALARPLRSATSAHRALSAVEGRRRAPFAWLVRVLTRLFSS